MSGKKPYNLQDLPEELRSIFLHAKDQLNNAGDLITSVEFSFLSMIIFSVDFQDDKKNQEASRAKELLYELFGNNKTYVDDKLAKLPTNLNEPDLQGLYSQGIVYFWTNLESFVKRLIAYFIRFDEELLAAEQFRKTQISIADFYSLAPDKRSEYITNVIIEKLNCANKLGGYRFECFLEPFGLDGPVPKKHLRNLLAVHQLRNCIVHNESIADNRIVDSCAWLKYAVGDKLKITRKQILEYEASILYYQGLIFFRVNKKLGAPASNLHRIRHMMNSAFDEN